MFHSTTHYKYWIFSDQDKLNRRRAAANESFVNECRSKLQQAQCSQTPPYISVAEETIMTNHYLTVLKDFCRKFKPAMPKSVMSTAIQYFKRFYLNNSVMEYHPKHIMATCVFLATKIEEFNVTMQQFVNNIKGDRSKASDIVLNNELLLLHQLGYHLTICHPYRPIEGFLIDIKTRYPEFNDPERLRKYIDTFLDKSFSTDACFLLCPNQLALLALIYATQELGESLDEYLNILFANNPEEIQYLKLWLQKLLHMISTVEPSSKEIVKQIEAKVEQCQVLLSSVFESDQSNETFDDEDE